MKFDLEALEEARALVAYAVIRHRKKFAPVLERFDKEVEAARKDDPVAKAQRILAGYKRDGGLSAIRVSQP